MSSEWTLGVSAWRVRDGNGIHTVNIDLLNVNLILSYPVMKHALYTLRIVGAGDQLMNSYLALLIFNNFHKIQFITVASGNNFNENDSIL